MLQTWLCAGRSVSRWSAASYEQGLDSSVIAQYFLLLLLWGGFIPFQNLKVHMQMVLEEVRAKLKVSARLYGKF